MVNVTTKLISSIFWYKVTTYIGEGTEFLPCFLTLGFYVGIKALFYFNELTKEFLIVATCNLCSIILFSFILSGMSY